MSFTRRFMLRAAGALVGGAVALSAIAAKAEDTIKIGILHSLSGTMAISETTLKDVMLMLIEKQNAAGGVLGRKLEPVVVDPASNWPLFAEKARELIAKDKVSVVFGCWTSVSRKSVLPVFEKDDVCSSVRFSTRLRNPRGKSSTRERLPISGRLQETTHV